MRSTSTARRSLRFVLAFVFFAVSGCAGVIVADDQPYQHAYKVPPGHLPPPGQCRIWYPELPPGQQPPPGDCYDLQRRVPHDAYLIYGD